jgi:hypothetical protein
MSSNSTNQAKNLIRSYLKKYLNEYIKEHQIEDNFSNISLDDKVEYLLEEKNYFIDILNKYKEECFNYDMDPNNNDLDFKKKLFKKYSKYYANKYILGKKNKKHVSFADIISNVVIKTMKTNQKITQRQ